MQIRGAPVPPTQEAHSSEIGNDEQIVREMGQWRNAAAEPCECARGVKNQPVHRAEKRAVFDASLHEKAVNLDARWAKAFLEGPQHFAKEPIARFKVTGFAKATAKLHQQAPQTEGIQQVQL